MKFIVYYQYMLLTFTSILHNCCLESTLRTGAKSPDNVKPQPPAESTELRWLRLYVVLPALNTKLHNSTVCIMKINKINRVTFIRVIIFIRVITSAIVF